MRGVRLRQGAEPRYQARRRAVESCKTRGWQRSGPPAANAADDEQQRDDDNDRPSRTPRITGRGPGTITVSD